MPRLSPFHRTLLATVLAFAAAAAIVYPSATGSMAGKGVNTALRP